MSSQFKPLQIPPGVVAMPTKNMSSSNWAEVNLMRWVEGEMQPIGGQAQYLFYGSGGNSIPGFASRCKAIHGWYDLNEKYRVAYVCEQNVYIYTPQTPNSGILVEITPSGGWPPTTPPGQGGYGDLTYGSDTYGTPRASSSIPNVDQLPNVWSVDNFGAILLVQYSADGRLLEWNPATGGLLTQVPGSPIGRGFVITPQEFVVMYGTTVDSTGNGFPWRFGWCDQGDYTDWNYSSVTNQAGYLDIAPASPIVTACNGRFGVLMFTGKKAYIVAYVALPYVYNYTELADNCTPWSPLSITPTSSFMLWMSDQGMFSWDGATIAPVSCLVRKWIFDSVDAANVREQAFAFHNAQFNEFWWFFPISSNPPYNSRCVIYNYKEGWWAQGIMSRSAGITSSYTVQPILANGDLAYQHEMGPAYSIDTQPPFAETFDLNIAAGTRLTTLKQILPDVSGDWENIQFSFWTSNSRSVGGTIAGNWSAPKTINSKGYVDVRQTGRDIRMRISMIGLNVAPWTMGQHLYDAVPRGDR